MNKIQEKKFQILNDVFKSKDGLTWNELTEDLNELIKMSSINFIEWITSNDIRHGEKGWNIWDSKLENYVFKTPEELYEMFLNAGPAQIAQKNEFVIPAVIGGAKCNRIKKWDDCPEEANESKCRGCNAFF